MRTRQLALLLLLPLGGCTDSAFEPIDRAPPTLTESRWHAQVARNQTLPVNVSESIVNGALEQTFLDSARLDLRADSSWLLLSYSTRFRSGLPYERAVQSTYGRWRWRDTAFVLVGDDDGTSGWVRQPSTDSLRMQIALQGVSGMTSATLHPSLPPATRLGRWRARAVGGHALPFAVSIDDPWEEDGRVISIHVLADSATIDLHPTGRYTHRIWYSEWEGAPGGPPARKRHDWYFGDFGNFVLDGASVQTVSGWLQNHRMNGSFGASDTPLELRHGVGHGEQPLPFRYGR